MLKVLVVDDEALVCMGIRACIKWEENGFEFAGEARDGESAMAIMNEIHPDIVLTDIKMPGMGGVELLRKIRKDYPDVRVIILSCLNEMDIVRETLVLGAMDYVFKLSLRTEDLLEILNRAKAEIEQEREERYSKNREIQLLLQNRSMMEREILKQYLCRECGEKEFLEKIDLLSLKEEFSPVYILRVRLYPCREATESPEEKFNFLDWLQEQKNEFRSIAISLDGEYGVLLSAGDEEFFSETVLERIKDLFYKLEHLLYVKVVAAVSPKLQDLLQIQSWFSLLEEWLGEYFYCAEKTFIQGKNSRTFFNEKYYVPQQQEEKIFNELVAGSPGAVEREVKEVFMSIWKNASWKPHRVCRGIQSFLENLQRRVENLWPETDSGMPWNDTAAAETAATLEELYHITRCSLMALAEFLMGRLSPRKRTVELAKCFIERNIERNLTLEEVAAYVNISKNYFSMLFKQEEKESFTNYVNRKKIEKARQILLSGNYKVYEAAALVGMQNENYFSKLFKKYTGISAGNFLHGKIIDRKQNEKNS